MILDPLTRAKSWLTIEETTQVLGKHFGQEINKDDIHLYARDGKLRFSVIFKESPIVYVYQKMGKIIEDVLENVSFYYETQPQKQPINEEKITKEEMERRKATETEEEKRAREEKLKKNDE